jgi:thiol-disulfide isomerase/thioredoxin
MGVELSTIQFEPLTGDAERIRKDDLRGKVVLINFWGPWCPACRMEMPHLLELQKKFRDQDDFQLVLASYSQGSDFADHREQTAEYMRMLEVDQPTWHDPYNFTITALIQDAQLASADMPVTILLDQENILRALWAGFHPNDPADMAQQIRELLNSPGKPGGAEKPWAEQVADVREGRSEKIEIATPVITDADLAQLEGFRGLKTLSIERSSISDEGFQTLASLANLESLKIRGAEVTDAGVQRLDALANLRVVNLPQARFTNAGLASLSKLPNLELLRFGSPHVTDEGLKQVAAIESLRFLHLIHVPVSDAGLKHLYGMQTLESFYIDGGKVTDEGLSELLKALPGLHIHLDQQHLDNDPHAHNHKH